MNRRRSLRLLLLLPLLAIAALSVGAASAASAEDEAVVAKHADAGGTVTDSLQGKDGVRIQTMCTHCNSANIQVGGLVADLVPITKDGYPVLGGLATSYLFGVLPGDTIADAKVFKGPGHATVPATAAGGTIVLEGARPTEIPRLDATLTGATSSVVTSNVRAAGTLVRDLAGSIVVGRTQADAIDDDGDGWNDVADIRQDFAEAGLTWTPGRRHAFDVGLSWIDEEDRDGRGAYDVQRYVDGYQDAIRRAIAAWDPSNEPFPDFDALGAERTDAWTREDTRFERSEYRAGWNWQSRSADRLELRLLAADRDQSVRSQDTAVASSAFSEFFDRFRIDEEDRYGAFRYSRPIGLSLLVSAGVEAHEQEISALTLSEAGGEPGTPAVDYADTRSAYLEAEWHPTSSWTLELGGRYVELDWGGNGEAELQLNGTDFADVEFDREASELLPRAGVRFDPTAAVSVGVLYGGTARAPKPIFAEVCCGQRYQRSFFVEHEVGETLGFDFEYQPSPDLRLSAYAARTDFEDHIVRLVAWSQIYIQTYALTNVEDARAETAEIAVRWSPVERLQLDASMSWVTFVNRGDAAVDIAVIPPSNRTPTIVERPMERIPYVPERTGSLSAVYRTRQGTRLTAQLGYTGSMLIQQYARNPLLEGPDGGTNILLRELRETDDVWLLGLDVAVPVTGSVDFLAGVDNVFDEVQSDLGDPTTDYNWGPLVGRTLRAGVRFHLDRR